MFIIYVSITYYALPFTFFFHSDRPSEWRWHLDEACDGQWHHYALSVSYPQARLLLDGQPLDDARAPQILDDWPMQHVKPDIPTRFTIGACYEGARHRAAQFFSGYLAQLNLLMGSAESDRVLRCLRRCDESLDFPRIDDERGVTMHYRRDLSQLTVEAPTVDAIERVVRQLAYVNTRRRPTPGIRLVELKTELKCQLSGSSGSDDIGQVALDPQTVRIRVLANSDVPEQSSKTHFSVEGPSEMEVRVGDIRQGFSVFQDVVFSRTFADEWDMADGGGDELLERCLVNVHPLLVPGDEELVAPPGYAEQHGFHVSADDAHLSIEGRQTVAAYLDLLRQLMYFSSASVIPARQFQLTCSGPASDGGNVDYRFVVSFFCNVLT